MDRVSIELPEEDLAWALERVAAGEAESIDAYFRDLAVRDRDDAGQSDLIDQALADGDASEVDQRSHDQIFSELRARHQL